MLIAWILIKLIAPKVKLRKAENGADREIIKEQWETHCWDEVTYDLSHDYDEYDIEEDED